MDTVLDKWTTRFLTSPYRSRQFYELKDVGGKLLKPTYANGGTWLKDMGASPSLTAQMSRCILNHAPIGVYCQCFSFEEWGMHLWASV